MITTKGWNQKLMLSLFKKEATYNAAVTVSDANWCSIVGHTDFNPDFTDKVENDKAFVSGTEYGTTQQILEQGFKLGFSTENVTPNTLIGLVSLAEGSSTPTKEGAHAAYTHDIVEVAAGVATPSINLIGVKGAKQYLAKGIKVGGYEIKGSEGKSVSFSADLIGSGYRAVNADSFAAKISESWMLMNPSTIKIATGTDISIDTPLVQGTQNISATTPTNLSAAVKSFSFKRGFNLTEQRMGGAGLCSDIDYGRRTVECSIEMRYADYIALYEAQTPLALELECTQGAKIDAGGALYYGFKLVIPRCMLKKFPYPTGGVSDTLSCQFDLDIQNDGTNPVFKIQAYNAVAAYLA